MRAVDASVLVDAVNGDCDSFDGLRVVDSVRQGEDARPVFSRRFLVLSRGGALARRGC